MPTMTLSAHDCAALRAHLNGLLAAAERSGPDTDAALPTTDSLPIDSMRRLCKAAEDTAALASFDPAFALVVLDSIKGGSATFFREPLSEVLGYVERLRTCGALTLFNSHYSVIATLTPDGEALRKFLACWQSTGAV